MLLVHGQWWTSLYANTSCSQSSPRVMVLHYLPFYASLRFPQGHDCPDCAGNRHSALASTLSHHAAAFSVAEEPVCRLSFIHSVSEWVSEWVGEWVSEWTSERVAFGSRNTLVARVPFITRRDGWFPLPRSWHRPDSQSTGTDSIAGSDFEPTTSLCHSQCWCSYSSALLSTGPGTMHGRRPFDPIISWTLWTPVYPRVLNDS